jgi:hypothetical protein
MTIYYRIINSKALLILKGNDQFYLKVQMSMFATTRIADSNDQEEIYNLITAFRVQIPL